MKTIGLIGGMSWESSLEYYRILNLAVKRRLGGFHSSRCVMYSVNFERNMGYLNLVKLLNQSQNGAALLLKSLLLKHEMPSPLSREQNW